MTATRALATSAVWVAAAVCVVVFAVAYDDGGYALTSWSTVAVAVWWTIGVGVAVGVWPRARVTRAAVVPGALLAAFAGWNLASTAWSSSAEDAFAEEGIRGIRIYRRPGHRFGDLRRGADRAGAVLAVAESREEALERATRAESMIRFETVDVEALV